jgi:UDP-N-acetylglucosamine 4,6-dehydratase/5-epimerase
MLNDKTILVTGGTGSFGKEFVGSVLKKYDVKKIIIFSRDEMKQWSMAQEYPNDERLRFFIGDVRDRERVYRAMKKVDIVIHAAATKIVPTAEYNPFECVKTNINGAMNIIDACIDNGVERVVALSTDKASAPSNLYGATKLVSDKLFINGSNYIGEANTTFSVVRYGNVMGSRGSVIPFFWSIKNQKDIPITDLRMTRFMITLEDAVELVLEAIRSAQGGEIFVKKIPSMTIGEIANAINPNGEKKIIGIRPGEKLHEQMISSEDAPFTYDFGDHYRILPAINNWHLDAKRHQNMVKVPDGFLYTSNNNNSWMTAVDLSKWIQDNIQKLLEIK